MSREWKDKAGRVKRAKTFRQIRAGLARAKLWRERWKLHPETMRANLDRINGKRKADAEERTRRLRTFADTLPQQMDAGTMRESIGKSLAALGHRSDPPAVERILSALRRRSMVTFDAERLLWMVAKQSQ